MGEWIFCSGQVPLDPATGTMVEGDIGVQTRRVLENLNGVLKAAGSGLGDVVKTSVFLVDLDDFQQVNAVYAEFFPGVPPARATVEVSRLPANARVEIDAIAKCSSR